MKERRRFLKSLTAVVGAAVCQPTLAAFAQRGKLSDNQIIAGLKEALQIGTGNAINLTGRLDGFFKNAAIKILLPKQLNTVGRSCQKLLKYLSAQAH